MAKISWAGQACFSISLSGGKDQSAEIVIDPFSEDIGLKLPNLSADIVLVSHAHMDHNNVGDVKGSPFVIQEPGEYEVKGVFIQGIESFHDNEQGKERGKNTIYVMEAEGMRLCHLGDLGQTQLTDEQVEKIDTVDILMIPVGGNYTIDGAEAQKIISQLEPKIVIPMHFKLPKLKVELEDVSKFLKAMGKSDIAPVDKLNIKANALPKEGASEIIVLQP
jgi:L-ascorbate metabolism protein UlaG (beta-lactamase superfamily)